MEYKGKLDRYHLVNYYLANMEQEFFICQCNSTEHQLIFSYFTDDKFGDVYVTVHLVPDTFWKRIRNAIKYVFGHRSKYGDFDEFIFKKEDANKLQAIVDYLKA